MAKGPAENLADLVAGTVGLGTSDVVGPWYVTVGRQPDKPNRVITFYDTGGLAPNPKFRLNYPSVQVRIRGQQDAYDVTMTKAIDVQEFLLGMDAITLDKMHFSGVIGIGDVAFIGFDPTSRPEFTVNFRCFTEPAADSSAFMHRESL
jgi:hypothetical protein